MEYNKPPKTFEEQVELLTSRGLIIKNEERAESILREINYYRLRAYTIPFEITPHKFIEGTRIENIYSLYEFDRKLRKIIFNAIEFIEISLRSVIAYNWSHKYGPFGHEKIQNFKEKFNWEDWIVKVHKQAEDKEESEIFITHFKNTYEEYPSLPIWVMVETISMTLLSQFYSGMLKDDQISISKEYAIHSEVFRRWLHNFTYIRNICAHHSCLWNRNLSVKLVIPKDIRWSLLNGSKLGSVIFALNKVLGSKIFRKDIKILWQKDIETLIDNHPEVPDFWNKIGLSENWKESPLWKEEN